MQRNFILILMIFSCINGKDTLHFVVPDFKPFTYYDGEIKGIGVERVTHVLNLLNQPFTLSIVPNYGRAVEEIRAGRGDGFFLATQNDERDKIAQFSKPLFINRWCWFSLKKSNVFPIHNKSKLRVATIINTNTHKWLKEHRYNVTYPVTDVSAIIPLLIEGKVDVVFLAEEVFLQQLREHNMSEEIVDIDVQSERAFGVYIAKDYHEKNSKVLNRMNVLIDSLYKGK